MKNYPLTQLPVNQTYVNTLAASGVKTVKDVLDIGSSPTAGVPQEWFGALRSLAELLTVPGVGPKLAGQLYWAGIHSISDLAKCHPVDVCNAIREKDAESHSITEGRHFAFIANARDAALQMVK